MYTQGMKSYNRVNDLEKLFLNNGDTNQSELAQLQNIEILWFEILITNVHAL